MMTKEWHRIIASESHLSPDAARELRDIGFVVMPGPLVPGDCEQLSEAYDRAVATADPDDVHAGHSGPMRPETLQRIGDLAKYVLNVTSNKPMHATCEDARA